MKEQAAGGLVKLNFYWVCKQHICEKDAGFTKQSPKGSRVEDPDSYEVQKWFDKWI